jgi:hypothetical protein
MRFRYLALVGALVLAVGIKADAEVKFLTISATSTSQTKTFAPVAALLICSSGANVAYLRVFNTNDTPGDATTSSMPIVAGSATAPYCMSIVKSPTAPAFYNAISAVTNGADTATLNVYYE